MILTLFCVSAQAFSCIMLGWSLKSLSDLRQRRRARHVLGTFKVIGHEFVGGPRDGAPCVAVIRYRNAERDLWELTPEQADKLGEKLLQTVEAIRGDRPEWLEREEG